MTIRFAFACYFRKWIFLSLMLTTHLVLAQETPLITIRAAIQIALRKNINLGLYSNQVAASQVAADEADANFYPDVSASVTTSQNLLKGEPAQVMETPSTGSESPEEGGMPSGQAMDGSSAGFQISSRFSMLNILQSKAAQKSAKATVSSKEAHLKRLQQSVTFQVISDYLHVLQYQDLVKIEIENLETQQEQLQQIESFFKAGKRSEADMLLQQVDIKQSELDAIRAQRDLETIKIQLNETLGERGNVSFEFAGVDLNKSISFIETANPFENWQNREAWYDQRNDFQAQKLKIDAFRENTRAARALAFPSMSLNLDLGSNYYSSLARESFKEQVLKRNVFGRVGLSFSLPLFDRSRMKHNLQNAEIQLSDEHLNMEEMKLSIQSEIQQARLDFETARKQRESALAQEHYTAKALQITKERYAAGAATFVELSEARVKNTRAIYQKISADYNFVLQYATVGYAHGNLDNALGIIQ